MQTRITHTRTRRIFLGGRVVLDFYSIYLSYLHLQAQRYTTHPPELDFFVKERKKENRWLPTGGRTFLYTHIHIFLYILSAWIPYYHIPTGILKREEGEELNAERKKKDGIGRDDAIMWAATRFEILGSLLRVRKKYKKKRKGCIYSLQKERPITNITDARKYLEIPAQFAQKVYNSVTARNII